MNIDNCIATTHFSSELGGAAATGSQQGLANGVLESPENSLFQQLINQMLTINNQNSNAVPVTPAAGEKSNTGETTDGLSELLLAAGIFSNGGLQKTAAVIDETAREIKSTSDEKQEAGENAEATGLLQALMAGMTNTVAAVSSGKTIAAAQTSKVAVTQPADVNTSMIASGSPAATESMKQTADITAPQTGALETAAQNSGIARSAETAGKMTPAQLEIRQTPAEQKQTPQKGFLGEPEKTVLTSGEAETPIAFAAKEVKTMKAENEDQTMEFEIRAPEEAAVPAEKQKQTVLSPGDTDQAGTAFQHSVQGAVTTVDAANPATPDQTVESTQPYNQIREEILTKLEQKGPTEFKMQLQPEDLGQIDIKLKFSEGKLIIDILAADAKTQALLTSQVDKLISSMGLQNVQVESVQVSQQMNPQTQDSSQSQGFTMNSAMDFSQRKQEQSRQEIFNNSRPAGAFSQQQDETKTNETLNRIGTIRLNTHRMNYSV